MNGAAQWGYCPVTGKNVSVASAFQVNFINGQKLYVADAAAAAAYRAAPQAFWLSPHESPLPMPDGMRGLPDFRGKAFQCPRSGENITGGHENATCGAPPRPVGLLLLLWLRHSVLDGPDEPHRQRDGADGPLDVFTRSFIATSSSSPSPCRPCPSSPPSSSPPCA